jgi:hypothetical protein
MKWLHGLILVLVIGVVATPGYSQRSTTPAKPETKAKKTKVKEANEPKADKKMSAGQSAAYAGAYAKGVPQGQASAPK